METTMSLLGCLLAVVAAALMLTAVICVWVYQDAKERGERAWMWVLILLLSSPIVGGIIYLIVRKEEKIPCRFCGWMLERGSFYCSRCGKANPFCDSGSGYREDLPVQQGEKQKRRNRCGLIGVVVSSLLLVFSLIGTIVLAVNGTDNPFADSSGWVMMNLESSWDNVWKFQYGKASENYRTSSSLKVEQPHQQSLAVRVTFEEGETMRMKVSQGEQEMEIELESKEQTQYFPLDQFEPGKIRVTVWGNGAQGVKAQVSVSEPSDALLDKEADSGYISSRRNGVL